MIAPIDYRLDLLPHFITYYSNLGIQRFVFTLWNGVKNPCLDRLLKTWEAVAPKEASFLIRPLVMCPFEEFTGGETIGLNDVRAEIAERYPGSWITIADQDEFIYYGERGPAEQVEALKAEGMVALMGEFHDRVSPDGAFRPVPPFGQATLDETYPMAVDLTKHCGGLTSKSVLLRPDIFIHIGHHRIDYELEPLARKGAEVHHFKWHGGVLDTLEVRRRNLSAQKAGWVSETEWLLEFLNRKGWWRYSFLKMREARKIGA